ncbi:type 1 periplasmic-binding domain-containing protein [Kitasatospora indigofera]|uniref:BMP family ABC transporter substrate-binding protein n=1 Tax=Kitasatospora indigofera TaxID=67307 RepID=UPI0036B718C9
MDRRRVWWVAGAGVVLLAVAVVLAVMVPGREPERLPVRAREYTDVRVCLLTDEQGVASAQAAPVWGGMQDASAATKAQVSFLSVMGPGTVANAQSYANTLVQRKCSMVLGAGGLPGQALRAIAGANPKVRFVVVGEGASASNVTAVQSSGDVRGSVAKIVLDGGKA